MTIDGLRFGSDGLLPVAIVDARTGALLTLAYANREAVEKTIATGATHLWSRSRSKLWRKGEESGNTQRVVAIVADCDGDALMYRVVPAGPACHTGEDSCFHDVLAAPKDGDVTGTFVTALGRLERTIDARRDASPEQSYTAKLLAGGVDRIGKKIGEEATELVIAAKNNNREEVVWEAADLLYHTLVLLAEQNVSLDEVGAEFSKRAK
jgi:phosphoribosyl-ATP pyrophosphohydrolase/phosphoribosyl-AMP cyclohydrolase